MSSVSQNQTQPSGEQSRGQLSLEQIIHEQMEFDFGQRGQS